MEVKRVPEKSARYLSAAGALDLARITSVHRTREKAINKYQVLPMGHKFAHPEMVYG